MKQQVKGQEVLMVKQRKCKHPLPISTTPMLHSFGYVVDSEIDIEEQEEGNEEESKLDQVY